MLKSRRVKIQKTAQNQLVLKDFEVFDDIDWLAELFDMFAHDSQAHFFTAYAEGKFAGFCAVYHNTANPQHFCKIMDLRVVPQLRKKGIGRALMGQIIDLADKLCLNLIKLEVNTKNQAALNLYNSLGFKTERLEKGLYGDDGDGYVMFRTANTTN